jgi:uncharacterized Tic20 family protein
MKHEERSMAALAHLAAIIPLWGILFAGIIWLQFKEKSKHVVFHAQQAIFFQVILLIVIIVALVFRLFCSIIAVVNSSLASILNAGNLFLLIVCLILYGAACLYAAWSVLEGRAFEYPFIGKQLRESEPESDAK